MEFLGNLDRICQGMRLLWMWDVAGIYLEPLGIRLCTYLDGNTDYVFRSGGDNIARNVPMLQAYFISSFCIIEDLVVF